MLFNSSHFLLFFPVVTLLYFLLPVRLRNYWLLIASYYFYMSWNAVYAILIFTSTVITYISGLLLEKVRSICNGECRTATCKWVVALSFFANLGILFYFKYFNFASDILTELFRIAHLQLTVPHFDLLLPVGISFYTFQALSYTMDVYRGEIYAERNFFRYALFVSFFPQLVAGPIERSRDLLKQLTAVQHFDFDRARDGLLLMLWGYFLKMVLADRIAPFVDAIYNHPELYFGWYYIAATVLFAFQIYCDFFGYSTIALGAAQILGFRLTDNFNAPYLSESVSSFWRNWHITLTSWFTDYLYIPLGGNRKGKPRKYLNKLIVFLCSGLWHGARITFVIWGGLNGLYQIFGELAMPLRDKAVHILRLHRESLAHRAVSVITTFALVDISWVFFRANTLSDALRILKGMTRLGNIWVLWDGSLSKCGLTSADFTILFLSTAILLISDLCKRNHIQIRKIIAAQDGWFRIAFLVLSICAILTFGIWGPGYQAADFIYFQF